MRTSNMTSSARRLLLASLSALPIAVTALPAAAAAPPDTINIPGERIFPESLTSLSDGSVIIGSIAQKTVYRAK